MAVTRCPARLAAEHTRRRCAWSSGPGSTTTAVAEPGSAISQVLVPSSVIGDGLGASTQRARAVPDPSMPGSGGPPETWAVTADTQSQWVLLVAGDLDPGRACSHGDLRQ